MTFPKPAASLTSGLLARKGGARPAMRRQTTSLGPRAVSLDDLGWDDMGEEALPVESPVAQHIETIRVTLSDEARVPVAEAPITPAPAVETPAAQTPVVAAPALGRKSAFTLRLDAERHLHLRLLSAVTNRSAQQLVTAALDDLLARHPNIADLAADPKARLAAQSGME